MSTDRLAGLDNMILKITTPSKVPKLIPNHPLHQIPVGKLRKHPEARTPLADNNLPPASHHSMFLHALSTAGEANLLPPSSPRVSCSPDLPNFRPLPPLPSASTLQLPSFLHLSTRSFASLRDPSSRHSAISLPPPDLFRVSSPVASLHRAVACKSRDDKVFEGPQWIPAFHNPNSPYVPWSSLVRRRILPPPSPLPSPVCPSPCVRSGAVAPEPWASSTFLPAQQKSAKEKLSSSWKSLKNSVKKRVKAVVSRLGRSKLSLSPPCIGQDILSIYDDTDTTAAVQHRTSHPLRSAPVKAHPRDSLASFVSSDSTTLAVWLAERQIAASCVIEDTPREMSVGEYELMGSWLDLRHGHGGWLCGIEDCDMHTVGGSPYAASKYPFRLRMAMPFDTADVLSGMRPPPKAPAVEFPAGPFSAPPRCHSLPLLSFGIHSVQEPKLENLNSLER